MKRTNPTQTKEFITKDRRKTKTGGLKTRKTGDSISYDTSREETSNPQKVRETNEPEAQHARSKKMKGE